MQIWLIAIRPKTLPAAAAPVIVGSALAFRHAHFRLSTAFAALMGALLLQIGSNLVNDLFDYQKGADQGERFGPIRVSQSGLLKSSQLKIGILVVFLLAIFDGIYLASIAGIVVIIVGVASIVAAFMYTGGPYPLAYHGLGDIFVFVFFGLIATVGTFYVQAGYVSLDVYFSSLPVGLLIVNILVVNNLRDIASDRKNGKNTLAVRLGVYWTRLQYVSLLAVAFLSPLIAWLLFNHHPWILLSWFTLPLAVRLVVSIYKDAGRLLNRTLAHSGRLALLFSVTFSAGIIIETMLN